MFHNFTNCNFPKHLNSFFVLALVARRKFVTLCVRYFVKANSFSWFLLAFLMAFSFVFVFGTLRDEYRLANVTKKLKYLMVENRKIQLNTREFFYPLRPFFFKLGQAWIACVFEVPLYRLHYFDNKSVMSCLSPSIFKIMKI